MHVAVAILNYNGERLLPRFLPSVLQHTVNGNGYTTETIVIDNASTDESEELLRRNFPDLRVIRLGSNTGYSGGYNRGLAQIQADVFVLLNSDIEVTAGWLDGPMAMLARQPEVAAVQPKIRSAVQREKFDYAGAGGGYMDALGYPYCRGRIFETIETDHGQYNDDREVMWASGACLFVRSQDFYNGGGLDERFFAHMEEIDLCWKLRRQGRKVMYCGSGTVFHLGGGTLPAGNARKTYLNFRNNLSLLFRHLPGGKVFFILTLRFLLDTLAAISFLTSGKGKSTIAVFKAYRDFIMDLKAELGVRRSLRHLPFPPDLPGNGSIVFRYYLLRKKTFQ